MDGGSLRTGAFLGHEVAGRLVEFYDWMLLGMMFH